jgi:CheY-like chemotaxis protein
MHLTVLVVEDDTDLRECMCGFFEVRGYHAIGANNGREALDYLAANELPCLILLDLMMPVMSGWDFLFFRQRNASLTGVPVAVLSAVADQNAAALKAASVVLRKPVAIEDLIKVLKTYCGDPD